MSKIYKSAVLAISTESVINSEFMQRCKKEGSDNINQFIEFDQGIECFPFDNNSLWVGPRQNLETNDQFKQIIPYVIVERDDKFLLYKRTQSGNEARLHNKVSIGFGGHIDIGDIMTTDNGESIDLETTVATSAQREIAEELKSTLITSFEAFGVIIDNSDLVGKVHVGIVIIARVSGMVLSNEDQIELLGFKSAEDIIENYSESLEGWSYKVLSHIERNGLPL